MKGIILYVTFSLLAGICFGQNNGSWTLFPSQKDSVSPAFGKDKSLNDTGYVHIIKDDRLDDLMEKYRHNHEIEDHIKGFRIQIFSSSGANSRLRARNALLKFNENYSDVVAYLKFESPNFQVRVGDFRNRYEAEKLLNHIKENYPGAFIKSDIIALPPISKPKIEQKMDANTTKSVR